MHPPKVKIFVAHHKPYWKLATDVYVPIHAGRAVSNAKLDMIGDDSGDNISGKNRRYSEFSATYWIWKHLDEIEADFVGLCAYRRYFNFLETGRDRLYNWLITREGRWSYRLNKLCDAWGLDGRMRMVRRIGTAFLDAAGVNDPAVIHRALDGCDALINRPVHCGMTLAEQYNRSANPADFALMEEILAEVHPDWTGWARECFHRRPIFFNNLLVLARKDVFRQWHEWMFSILTPLDERIPRYQDPYQERAMSFLAERLTHLYFTRMREDGALRVRPLSSFILELEEG